LRSNILEKYYEDKATPRQRTYASTVSGGVAGGVVTRLMGNFPAFFLDTRSSSSALLTILQAVGLSRDSLFSPFLDVLGRPHTIPSINGS
jgi:hypothetical protein